MATQCTSCVPGWLLSVAWGASPPTLTPASCENHRRSARQCLRHLKRTTRSGADVAPLDRKDRGSKANQGEKEHEREVAAVDAVAHGVAEELERREVERPVRPPEERTDLRGEVAA